MARILEGLVKWLLGFLLNEHLSSSFASGLHCADSCGYTSHLVLNLGSRQALSTTVVQKWFPGMQVVWKSSQRLGCATAYNSSCRFSRVYVCSYSPVRGETLESLARLGICRTSSLDQFWRSVV
jgi:hypothetical protein